MSEPADLSCPCGPGAYGSQADGSDSAVEASLEGPVLDSLCIDTRGEEKVW